MDIKLIGDRVKKLRTQNTSFSQEEFAKVVGLDRTYMSRVESGKQNVTIETLIRICDGLGISLKDFFDFYHDFPSIFLTYFSKCGPPVFDTLLLPLLLQRYKRVFFPYSSAVLIHYEKRRMIQLIYS